MKKCLVVTGGSIDISFVKDFLQNRRYDWIVAVDAGLEILSHLHIVQMCIRDRSFIMPGYGMGYYRFFDPTMILVLIGVVLSMAASAKVQSTFAKYSRVRSMTGMTGAEAAKRLLNSQGIYDVQVRKVAGNLTDHYDPRNKTLNLSESVYDSPSVAAIGVAAHECGHAIQDNTEYAPLKIRGAIVPVVNIGTQLSWPMILLGVLFGGLGSPLVQIGILLFTL